MTKLHTNGIVIIVFVFGNIFGVVSAQTNCGPVCPSPLELKADTVVAGGTCGCNPDLPADNSSTPSCNCSPGGYELTCDFYNTESLGTTDLTQCNDVNGPRMKRLCCHNPNYNLCPVPGSGAGVAPPMGFPGRQLFQGDSYYTTCQSISDMLSLLPHVPKEAFYGDEWELLNYDVDWPSLCGCPDSDPPNICSVCGGNKQREIQGGSSWLQAPDDYPLLGDCISPPSVTCSQAIALTKSIKNVSACDGWLRPVDAACCTGGNTSYVFPKCDHIHGGGHADMSAASDQDPSLTVSPAGIPTVSPTGPPTGTPGGTGGNDYVGMSAATRCVMQGLAGIAMFLVFLIDVARNV
eukprot:CAMPEP_0197433598 /NCGR_PEP_ID=MMETSP1175-20131217/1459_1 /TAXON_ID=1003142 /ORGANISM="Triceratium dubium, Strain CCMP147" /LENGTH=349 /DNA_ID=CAMNT_0042962035 /DNA_START=78 /DNA_END=1127 /DNA_ORIENTATION=+